jgi:hypothetical protein
MSHHHQMTNPHRLRVVARRTARWNVDYHRTPTLFGVLCEEISAKKFLDRSKKKGKCKQRHVIFQHVIFQNVIFRHHIQVSISTLQSYDSH